MGDGAERPRVSTASRPARRARSLSLDPDALRRGEEFSRRNGTTLPRLVEDFLRSLPLEPPQRELSPAVRRLLEVAAGGRTTREDHREHLHRKYGGR